MPSFSRLFLTAYGGLWRAATPLLKRHRRLREGFAQRLVPSGWPGHAGPRAAMTVWIQAASGGEALLAESLVESLGRILLLRMGLPEGEGKSREDDRSRDAATVTPPLLDVVCTTCTRQGLDVLERAASSNRQTCLRITPAYFPLDIPALMGRALDQASPDVVVLLETELWPGLLHAAKSRNIPVMVVNGRMTEKSALAYRPLRGFFAANGAGDILATTPENAGRFASLFPRARVGEMLNIKFDIANRLLSFDREPDGPSPRRIAGVPENTPLALLASVREEEEAILAETVRRLLQADEHGSTPLVVIAPRHMHRVSAWTDRLASMGVTSVLRSQHAPHGDAPNVVIWDAFGELFHLYASSDAVFVGGSFAPLGGQNFLEPLAFGKRPFVGPSIYNFSWVGEGIVNAGLVCPLSCPDDLAPAMLDRLRASERGEEQAVSVRQRFAAWLSPQRGGSEFAADKISEVLNLSKKIVPDR